MTVQLDSQGRLRHLITLDGLGRDMIERIVNRAERYLVEPGKPGSGDGSLEGLTVCNLFFEASTRTQVSFELAAKRQGAEVVNLVIPISSASKGETVLDTMLTIRAMGVDFFVVRHHEAGLMNLLARDLQDRTGLINAGEGHMSHPTQGLLDALTIRQHKPDLKNLSVAIVGDTKHSRVARSACHALLALGVQDLRLVAPESLLPGQNELSHTRRYTDPDEGIAGCDVVMVLRIQKERMEAANIPNPGEYHHLFGLTPKRLKLASANAIVMHPGPMNRGVEIDSDVADGPQSVIRKQVGNGVAIRMAVLAELADARRP